ncbi:hypothetical protein EJB05_23064, partial [Eragrostis curvula]
MDIVISAVVSELVSRFISFLSKKYTSKACLKENIESLQHLLLRVHTVIEEAEGRYIENSRMLVQLKTLKEAMYRGIRSSYSSILHFSEDDIDKIDQRKFKRVRTLAIIEFVSDVTHKEWHKFYSLVACTGKGSKVIIISRSEKHARLGTVNPIRIHSFSQEEYSYLFKVLAFGSTNPMDHPQLALIGKELATMFQGSLIMLNVYASVLRNNQNVRFWSRTLELFRVIMQNNLATFGEHPKTLLERHGAAVDITGFTLSSQSGTLFRLVLQTTEKNAYKGDLPTMSFGDIIAGSTILPKKFQLVWKSRLPPYNVICANCTAEMPEHPALPRKKRQKSCNLPA